MTHEIVIRFRLQIEIEPPTTPKTPIEILDRPGSGSTSRRRGRPHKATSEDITALLGSEGARYTHWRLLAKASGISASTFKRLWRKAITDRLVVRVGKTYKAANVDKAPVDGGRDVQNGARGRAILDVSPNRAASKKGGARGL